MTTVHRHVKVLFLSQRVPYPPNRGDKITTWRIVEKLAREHEPIVIAFAHDDDDREAARVLREERGIRTITVDHDERAKKLGALPLLFTRKALTLGVYGSKELQRVVDEELEDADLAYAYSSSMGAFLEGRGTPWVMHFAELDSDKWRQYAERHRLPMSLVYRREWRTLRAFEQRVRRGPPRDDLHRARGARRPGRRPAPRRQGRAAPLRALAAG